jgi:hypothetical protein
MGVTEGGLTAETDEDVADVFRRTNGWNIDD